MTILRWSLALTLLTTACADGPTLPTSNGPLPSLTTTNPANTAAISPAAPLRCADISGQLERRNGDHDKAWAVLIRPAGATLAHELVTVISTLNGAPFDWDQAWGAPAWYLDSDRTWAYIDTPVQGRWTVTFNCGDRVLAQWTS